MVASHSILTSTQVHKGTGVDDKPNKWQSPSLYSRNMDRGTASTKPHSCGFAAAVCARGLFRLPRMPDARMPGCQDPRSPRTQGHPSSWTSGRSAWSPRWPTARAPATARPRSYQQGRTMSPDPTVVRSSPNLWANDKTGLGRDWDGTGRTGWACCASVTLRATNSLSASARGLSLVSSSARVVPSVSVHSQSSRPCPALQRRRRYGVHRYKSTMPLYSPRPPSYTPYMLPPLSYSRPHEPKHSPAILPKAPLSTDKLPLT